MSLSIEADQLEDVWGTISELSCCFEGIRGLNAFYNGDWENKHDYLYESARE
jgi:hypothetical protein